MWTGRVRELEIYCYLIQSHCVMMQHSNKVSLNSLGRALGRRSLMWNNVN